MEYRFLKLEQSDNVAIALQDVPKGVTVELEGAPTVTADSIPRAHKICIRDIRQGETIVRYGNVIGRATADIRRGQWVHSHNAETTLTGFSEYSYRPRGQAAAPRLPERNTFEGYVRGDGRVGTRNEVWVIPTVSCVNETAEQIARTANEKYGAFCDGVFAYPHSTGCSQTGEDLIRTQRLLAGLALHPNAGGVLLVSLGCENNSPEYFLPFLGDYDKKRIRTLVTQEIAGDETEEGVRIVGELADALRADQRERVPVSKLTVGLKCGGSDALSGVTANPLCGRISDIVTALGGTAFLTEVPEMFGAEQRLMDRAADREVYEDIVKLINGFKAYYLDAGDPVYENPSPGNKAGGLTTLEEKSTGCIQKGGSAKITKVLDYGERSGTPGLNILKGPGSDGISVTNLCASGAQLILFTTGRGNPLGAPVPTVKISSNTELSRRKPGWIDFDAGALADCGEMDKLTEELWNELLDVASGKKTKNETAQRRSILIMKDGVVL